MNRYIQFVMVALGVTFVVGCATQGVNPDQAIQGVLGGVVKVLAAPAAGQGAPDQAAADPTSGEVIGLDWIPIRVGGKRPTEQRWAGVPLRDTKLMGLFTDKPVGDCHPCFPRVAVVVKDYSESLLSQPLGMNYKGNPNPPPPRPDECIKFDATLWANAKHSEQLKNVVVCNADIRKTDKVYPKVVMGDFSSSFGRVPHTYEVRSTGPKPPYRLVALDSHEDSALWRNGFYLFGNMFVLMGYQGARQMVGVMEDRMWFVNMAKKPAG